MTEKLIAEARELLTKWNDTSYSFFSFVGDARYLIPALCDALEQAQNAQRWIPVAERLPTKEDADSGGDVLAWYKSEYNLYRKAGGYALQIKYDDTDFVTHAAALTHWMPLPQPPKGECE